MKRQIHQGDFEVTDEGILGTASYVWDTNTLSWVKATQAGSAGGGGGGDASASNQVSGLTKLDTVITRLQSLLTELQLKADLTESQLVDQRRNKTVLFASVSVSSSGNNQIVAASSTEKIKVLSYSLVTDSAVAVKWRSANTDLTGAMSFLSNSGVSTPVGSPASGWLLETAVNEALNLNLSAAVGVRGHISYFLET